MHNRSIRRLNHLQSTASTCRVLNLIKIAEQARFDDEYRLKPMFRNRLLNQSIILKHRLRGNEIDLFDDHRTVATKIILPMDRSDLNAGGQYMFIGQKNQAGALSQMMGEGDADNMIDLRTLRVLDDLPSFDPFLLREQLRRNGLNPAQCYFAISPADARRMMGYVQTELGGLANLIIERPDQHMQSAASLAAKLMSDGSNDDMEPLRLSMRMSPTEYAEGLFAWRGLLYYKWVLSEMQAQMPEVIRQLQAVQPFDLPSQEMRSQITQSRRRIQVAINQSRLAAEKIIRVYDHAFAALSRKGEPLVFRDFLRLAPDLFLELGENLGVLSHIISFWRFRFPAHSFVPVSVSELIDILLDFEGGLAGSRPPSPQLQLHAFS